MGCTCRATAGAEGSGRAWRESCAEHGDGTEWLRKLKAEAADGAEEADASREEWIAWKRKAQIT